MIDLDLAIWQLNPQAEYCLDAEKTQIKEWRGPGEQPTIEQLAAAWDTYQQAQRDQMAQQATALADARSQRQALVDTILSRPAIAGDPELQEALAAFLAQFLNAPIPQ